MARTERKRRRSPYTFLIASANLQDTNRETAAESRRRIRRIGWSSMRENEPYPNEDGRSISFHTPIKDSKWGEGRSEEERGPFLQKK